VEYERSGTLQVALDGAEAEGLTTLARTFAAADVDHSLMDGADACRLEPSLPGTVVNALLVPQHGYVAVGPLTRAIARGAVSLGATLATESIPSLTADLGADAVVGATGSWTDELLDVAPRKGAPHDPDPNRRAGLYAPPAVKPIRGQLLQLRMPRRAAGRVIWGKQCYAVPWQDGTVLLGATVEDVGFDERATVEGVQGLLTEGVRLLPSLAGAAFEEVRTGLRPMTRDELPAVGPSSTMPGVFYATGHYRNGVLLAPLTAMLMADLLIDGRAGAELAQLSPARFGL
jgi:glycine oxidase